MPIDAKASTDWQELTQLTHGHPIVVERVRLSGKGIQFIASLEAPLF